MKEGIQYILGKTIEAVVVSDENIRGPWTQVFLVFRDGTALELYGDVFTCASGLDRGGLESAARYAASPAARFESMTRKSPKRRSMTLC